ncbi:MAG: tagaturonate reductase [Spirochaetales bacterium]|uniref:Tagaturonate reductase n=1 Tax=Candidatus Thalassospirochaeta sargassi TaxID=3119039 RepID=A0AAJ1IF53_9SPIO|nr:tagaturonate reductase [Spirochaetales bacterium]
MKKLNRSNFNYPEKPVRVLQFGEGNFLRCFIDWQIDILNEKKGFDAGVVVVRPIDSDIPPLLNTQDGLYTSVLRGFDENGNFQDTKRTISAVVREIPIYKQYHEFLELAGNPDLRFIVSNTTEAGIAYDEADRFDDQPPGTYPAKLTRFLFERYKAFDGADNKGFILLPCELIDYNGDKLKEIVLKYCKLWSLSAEFADWIETCNIFCSTLVDRIVTGRPSDEYTEIQNELGYEDNFIVTGEFFHLFVIQGPDVVAQELMIEDSGLNIKIVDDLKPYKVRKVGILNGCHTSLVPVAFLSGLNLVKESIEDDLLGRYLDKLVNEEIIPYLGLPVDYVKDFADSVFDRFRNPYVKHQLISISLNSMTKFKTRLLPQFLNYVDTNKKIPPMMAIALSALICFYRGERISNGNPERYEMKDDAKILELYKRLWKTAPTNIEEAEKIAGEVLSLEEHWGRKLSAIEGLTGVVAENILNICKDGMRAALTRRLND